MALVRDRADARRSIERSKHRSCTAETILDTFFLLPLLLVLFFEQLGVSGAVGALWGASIALVFMTAEAGIWEDYFKRVPQVQGGAPTDPLLGNPEHCLLDELASYERVVFTGHSLGGAVATIAFMVYSCRCRSQGAKENAVLVTFGAPRIGDMDFVNEFSSRFKGRFVHVQHPGDPVPDLPPNGMRELIARRFWMRGPLGCLVILLYFGWTIVARLYRAPRAARWGDGTTHEVAPGTRWLSFKSHSMADVYYRWAQSYAAKNRPE
ncbi:lipase family protein [uncultured Zoogloea sp.]|uniref:lipase family protein n=1 Tax=uncultured Zoogloea sp. TaxID=160237 RepID=UPI00345B5FD0